MENTNLLVSTSRNLSTGTSNIVAAAFNAFNDVSDTISDASRLQSERAEWKGFMG